MCNRSCARLAPAKRVGEEEINLDAESLKAEKETKSQRLVHKERGNRKETNPETTCSVNAIQYRQSHASVTLHTSAKPTRMCYRSNS